MLRSLGAIHPAPALLLNADLGLTYDVHLPDACRENGLAAVAPQP